MHVGLRASHDKFKGHHFCVTTVLPHAYVGVESQVPVFVAEINVPRNTLFFADGENTTTLFHGN